MPKVTKSFHAVREDGSDWGRMVEFLIIVFRPFSCI
jgi:hypothetical protein